MNGSWQGRVVDTLRNVYSKTNFFVKHNSKLSPIIHNTMGVNQGEWQMDSSSENICPI